MVRQLATDVARTRAGLAEALANSDRTKQSFERFAKANDSARCAGRQGHYSEIDTRPAGSSPSPARPRCWVPGRRRNVRNSPLGRRSRG